MEDPYISALRDDGMEEHIQRNPTPRLTLLGTILLRECQRDWLDFFTDVDLSFEESLQGNHMEMVYRGSLVSFRDQRFSETFAPVVLKALVALQQNGSPPAGATCIFQGPNRIGRCNRPPMRGLSPTRSPGGFEIILKSRRERQIRPGRTQVLHFEPIISLYPVIRLDQDAARLCDFHEPLIQRAIEGLVWIEVP